jgi:hypothetical protein
VSAVERVFKQDSIIVNAISRLDMTQAWGEGKTSSSDGQRLPFALQGIDCDNDSVFINSTLLRYCESTQLTFTRSRSYRKNDQAFVEQKNGDIVRGNIGYRCYTSAEAVALIETIYEDLHAYVNFFQPARKLIHKERRGAKVFKQYDEARTPHQRLCSSRPWKTARSCACNMSTCYLIRLSYAAASKVT